MLFRSVRRSAVVALFFPCAILRASQAQELARCASIAAPPESVTVPLYVVIIPHTPGTLPNPEMKSDQRVQLDSLASAIAHYVTIAKPVQWATPQQAGDFIELPPEFKGKKFNGGRSPSARIRFGSPEQPALKNVYFEAHSNAPQFDSTLNDAIARLRASPQVNLSRLHEFLQFDALLDVWKWPDYGMAFVDSVRVPVATVRMVKEVSGNRTIGYPEGMRARSEEGFVQLLYVVTAEGRVDLNSVRVEEATNQFFLEAVRRNMSRWRYVPAAINGCAFPMKVRQPFTFSMAPK